jgi:hypothetical protein
MWGRLSTGGRLAIGHPSASSDSRACKEFVPKAFVFGLSGLNTEINWKWRCRTLCAFRSPVLVSIAMPRTVVELRSDPAVAHDVIESIFERTHGASKRTYIEFLATSIEYLSTRHPDRWGVTLFDDCLRLNVGWVECLVLRSKCLLVLVEKESAQIDTKLDGSSYVRAPGCDMTTISLSDLPDATSTLTEAHSAALSIAAKYRPPLNIRNAHSVGVTAFLAQALRRPILNPSYAASTEGSVWIQHDEEASPDLCLEGGRALVKVNRFERDRHARETCISHHGLRCSVCEMSFQERYGPTMGDFIHVHHLVPLSSIGTAYQVNPIADLRPVCPNCHAVIHRTDPPLSIEQAKALLSS